MNALVGFAYPRLHLAALLASMPGCHWLHVCVTYSGTYRSE